jgi:hypothetical protein
MQIMPDTWRELNPSAGCRGEHSPPACGPGCIYEPKANLASGTAYLRSLLDRFEGEVSLAVAAYNAGPGAVEDAARGGSPGAVPAIAETRRYTSAVLDLWTEGSVGLSSGQTRWLSGVAGVARVLLVIDALLLALVWFFRPAWAGATRR